MFVVRPLVQNRVYFIYEHNCWRVESSHLEKNSHHFLWVSFPLTCKSRRVDGDKGCLRSVSYRFSQHCFPCTCGTVQQKSFGRLSYVFEVVLHFQGSNNVKLKEFLRLFQSSDVWEQNVLFFVYQILFNGKNEFCVWSFPLGVNRVQIIAVVFSLIFLCFFFQRLLPRFLISPSALVDLDLFLSVVLFAYWSAGRVPYHWVFLLHVFMLYPIGLVLLRVLLYIFVDWVLVIFNMHLFSLVECKRFLVEWQCISTFLLRILIWIRISFR